MSVVPPLAVGVAAALVLPVLYRPPVDAPVADRFRPPASPYGTGNRGLAYAAKPGDTVRATAAGTVVFAGQVGGSLAVSVLHADGLRTTYSFLDSIAVHRGDRVDPGTELGRATTRFHLGARIDDVYVDPAALFDGPHRPRRARLVRNEEGRS